MGWILVDYLPPSIGFDRGQKDQVYKKRSDEKRNCKNEVGFEAERRQKRDGLRVSVFCHCRAGRDETGTHFESHRAQNRWGAYNGAPRDCKIDGCTVPCSTVAGTRARC